MLPFLYYSQARSGSLYPAIFAGLAFVSLSLSSVLPVFSSDSLESETLNDIQANILSNIVSPRHWLVAIPGGLPENLPEDTPSRWVIRVVPNGGEDDASLLLGSQEIIRFRAEVEGETAYQRACEAAATLKNTVETASQPAQLRQLLHAQLYQGQPALLVGNVPIAIADADTATRAGIPADKLVTTWHSYAHKALTAPWEPFVPVAKNSVVSLQSSVAWVKPVEKKLPVLASSFSEDLTAGKVDKTALTKALITAPVPKIASVQPLAKELPESSIPSEEFAKPKLGETTPRLLKPISTPSAFQTGMASWYGDQFHGRKTSSGQRFNMYGYTAAHRTLPFGTQLKVTNLANGRSVVVTVNDRGPFSHGRIIDLSKAAARDIGLVASGVAKVSLAMMPKRVALAAP